MPRKAGHYVKKRKNRRAGRAAQRALCLQRLAAGGPQAQHAQGFDMLAVGLFDNHPYLSLIHI